MLQAFREQKKIILSIEKERSDWINSRKKARIANFNPAPISLPQISEKDFENLRQICPVLKVFLTETLKFSKETSTASQVIPTYTKLKKFLEDNVSNPSFSQLTLDFCAYLLDQVSKRLNKINDNRILRFCMIVDPRFAYDVEIISKSSWENVEQDFISFCKKSIFYLIILFNLNKIIELYKSDFIDENPLTLEENPLTLEENPLTL